MVAYIPEIGYTSFSRGHSERAPIDYGFPLSEKQFDHQFYPTGRTLADHAFAKFKHPVRRLLEPSAGRGDLLAPTGNDDGDNGRYRNWSQRRVPASQIDCIEIDLQNHPLLAKQGYRVIGHDFLQYEGAAIYSHILMNPPFSAGADHVLHAWNLVLRRVGRHPQRRDAP